MPLIESISGIRGTIGGAPGKGLTPLDIVKFTSAYSMWLKKQGGKRLYRVIVGRDARVSGNMVNHMVCGTLMGMGIDVTDLGQATTPTVELAVQYEKADGGIILTASHNPAEWNALKLLNSRGEFISAADGAELLDIAGRQDFIYTEAAELGSYKNDNSFNRKHIEAVTALPLVDIEAISKCRFRVVADCVNSVGGMIIPDLLKALGVKEVIRLNCTPDGLFAHNPEPLPENLRKLSETVITSEADVGFAVDPDVDRLAIVSEDGSMFGEEYTLVAVADYVLSKNPGNTVSNLSSTKALKEITGHYGGKYFASAVGEVNVIEAMKKNLAVIGGEGNGGIIYPELHYGRDALVGIALFLTHLAKQNMKCSELRSRYPDYYMVKNRVNLSDAIETDSILRTIGDKYKDRPVNTIDGIRIELPGGWVHLRKSNTEPLIRIYAEGQDKETAEAMAGMVMKDIQELTGKGSV